MEEKQNETGAPKPSVAPEPPGTPKPEEAEKKQENLVSFKDFMKLDLRVAQILEAERVEKSEKLVRLQITLGEELGKRQIVAGIAKHYEAEALVGKKIAVVANLKPAKLMGIESQGMLLAGIDEANDYLELLSVGDALPAGSKIS